MRELTDFSTPGPMPSEALLALQVCAGNNPLFPNLKSLHLWSVTEQFVPFIPMFLSSRTTTIDITSPDSYPPIPIVASVITTFPTLSPDLQRIELASLPRDPKITAAVSEMLLAINRKALRYVHVDSPVTKEAREVMHNLPDLRGLSVVIEEDSSLPRVVLPNLTGLTVKYLRDNDWLEVFRGATFGKLESVTFYSTSGCVGDFLKAFKEVAITTSILATLSTLKSYTQYPWIPNYRALLPFTQLRELEIDFPCGRSCSSTINDDIIIDMARAMPKLEILRLDGLPCESIRNGVTSDGLTALAHHCLHLSILRIHFQVASLYPPTIFGDSSGNRLTPPREVCALTDLEVGSIPVPEGSTLMVALALLRIFPHIYFIDHYGTGWEEVMYAIDRSKRLVDLPGEEPSPACSNSS